MSARVGTVAIKELSVRRLTDLRQLDLFQREAAILQGLKHPGIPAYLEDFVVEGERFVSLYLVQELVDGRPLGFDTPMDEASVSRMIAEVAEVLVYLAGRRPPVVHRDIKPQNVMQRADKRFVLVDFGATRAAAGTLESATVAGTFGYMAPEQLQGGVVPASDIYGLAATAVALLAGRDAGAVVDPHRPGGWRQKVEVSDALADLLEEMLRVDAERRPDASAVRKRAAALAAGAPAPSKTKKKKQKRPPQGVEPKQKAAAAPAASTVPAPDLSRVRAELEPRRDRQSLADLAVKVTRDPIGQAGLLLVILVLLLILGLLAYAVTQKLELEVGLLPIIRIAVGSVLALYLVLVVIGARLDRQLTAAERRVLRFRRLRHLRRRNTQQSGWMPLVVILFLVYPLALIGLALGELFLGWLDLGYALALARRYLEERQRVAAA